MNAPVNAHVIEYVTEEVFRQGHDVGDLDGIERVAWMLDAWCYAIRVSRAQSLLLIDVVALGARVERVKNKNGHRTERVRVGSRHCPEPETIPYLLEQLFKKQEQLTPLQFYKEFELIHPFVDGNGRTGKILLNWLNGTLLAPIFPPADVFGHAIRNP